MDQSVIAGVGNVYRAEVLHRARLDPFTPGRDVPREVYDALWADLVRLMAVGVEVGSIVTREDDLERTLHWEGRGRFRASYEVYRRAGQACRRCGEKILAAELVARTGHLVPRVPGRALTPPRRHSCRRETPLVRARDAACAERPGRQSAASRRRISDCSAGFDVSASAARSSVSASSLRPRSASRCPRANRQGW